MEWSHASCYPGPRLGAHLSRRCRATCATWGVIGCRVELCGLGTHTLRDLQFGKQCPGNLQSHVQEKLSLLFRCCCQGLWDIPVSGRARSRSGVQTWIVPEGLLWVSPRCLPAPRKPRQKRSQLPSRKQVVTFFSLQRKGPLPGIPAGTETCLLEGLALARHSPCCHSEAAGTCVL